ncbi:MAG: hypothetical protein ACRBCI_11555 [Cellvibrionaceae bacterium]
MKSSSYGCAYSILFLLIVATLSACGSLGTSDQSDTSTTAASANQNKAEESTGSKFKLPKWPFGSNKTEVDSTSKSASSDKTEKVVSSDSKRDVKQNAKQTVEQPKGGQLDDIDTLVDEQEKVIISYRTSLIYMARAQSQMAIALELKEEAELMEAEAKALEADANSNSSGTGSFKKYSAVSKTTNAAIVKKLEESKEIKRSERQEFIKALDSFVATTTHLNQFYVETQPFFDSTVAFLQKNATTKGGWLGKISILQPLITGARKKLGTGLFVLRSAPPTGFDYMKTGKRFLDFLKSNNIEVPKDADQEIAKVAIPNWKLL